MSGAQRRQPPVIAFPDLAPLSLSVHLSVRACVRVCMYVRVCMCVSVYVCAGLGAGGACKALCATFLMYEKYFINKV